jgi:proteasome lid subunit RPN8/RPN11
METKLFISSEILTKIHRHGEAAYPEEGAGLLLGQEAEGKREVFDILPLTNSREDTARHNRYLITAEDMLAGEMEAIKRGVDIVGVFHSHPDHPNRPSEFDRDWALPWYSYIITSIQQGQQAGSRSWRLADDRSSFSEEAIVVSQPEQL